MIFSIISVLSLMKRQLSSYFSFSYFEVNFVSKMLEIKILTKNSTRNPNLEEVYEFIVSFLKIQVFIK